MERILENIPELPPEDVVDGVNPWKKAMNRILTGFALSSVTLNFFCLNYILPAVGAMLILLGFRTLRGENKWMRCCFALSSVRAVSLYLSLLLDTTVVDDRTEPIFIAVNTAAMLLTYLCFRKGLMSLQEKAGLPVNVSGATWLTVWYVLLLLLALVQYRGYVISIGLLICYVLIIRSLYKISKEIGDAGYAVSASAVRLSDRGLVTAVMLLLTVGAVAGYAFGSSFPMEWTPRRDTGVSDTHRIKNRLADLGFPEDVLEDLTDADILACDGAVSVVTVTSDHPVNGGRQVTEYRDGGFYTTTVYDVKELRITGVAVRLAGEREQWRIFHHFRWIAPHNKNGTECIQLWPAYRQGMGWVCDGDVSGQVLCDIDGVTYTSDYYYVGSKTYTSDSILFGAETSTDVFAEYSMNKKGEDHRGYLSYTVKESISGCILDSWINYTHQNTLLQFPAKTAMEYRITNSFGIGGAFVTVQDALQMYQGKALT